MINALLIVSILTWPFGQLLAFAPFGETLRFNLLDIFAALLFLVIVFSSFSRMRQDPLFRPLLFFILAAFLSLVVNADRASPASLAYLSRFVGYIAFYFAFRIEGVKKYQRYFASAIVVFLILGIGQYLFLPDVRFLRYLGFDDHYYRLVGSFFDPNFTGLILAVLVILLPWPYPVIPLAALVLTFSRASYLALVLGLIHLTLTGRRFRLLLALASLGLLVYFAPKPFGEGVNLFRTFSISSRIKNQEKALLLFVQKPIFGYGFNTFKQSGADEIPNLTSGVDNSFLFVLVTSGLVGFSAFLYFLKTAFIGIKSPPIGAATVAVFSHAFFNNSLFYSWVLAIFFLLASTRSKASARP